MRGLFVMAILLTASLTGCFGVPDGTIANGSVATIQFTALDPATLQPLVDPLTGSPAVDLVASFPVGSGQSGLGLAFEQALLGLTANATKRVQIEGNINEAFPEAATAERIFGPNPAQSAVPRQDFEAFVGQQPEVGMVFELTFFDAVVEAVNDTEVTYRVTPEPGQQDPLPNVGATLVTTIDGDTITQTLEPMVGATFAIQAAPFGGSTPMNLAPGSYYVKGAEGSQLLFGHNPFTLNHAVLGRDVTYDVTVLAVQGGTAGEATPVDGNFGVRQSPIFDQSGDGHHGSATPRPPHDPPAHDPDDGHTH